MASPPRRSPATSPPYPSNANLPGARKRPLTLSTNQSQLSKKRKTPSFSTSTSSAHPLRQTSFPPEESREGQRSPSVDSVVTAATGARSVAASGRGRKKGKQRKDDTQSVRSATKASATGDRSSRAEGADEEAEYEEDDYAAGEGPGMDVVDEGAKVDEAHEQRRMNVLVDAFNNDQSDRYDVYRRVKLKPAVVRRIVNQTLSQSVPPAVITSINGFTKVFLGTLIERAREIQEQEVCAAENSLPTPPQDQPSSPMTDTTQPDHNMLGISPEPGPGPSNSQPVPGDSPFEVDFRKEAPLRSKDGELGPLLPDHVREAFRRFRRDGEGGGAGVEGRSVGLGLPGAGAGRLRGRRLFK